MAIQTIKCTKLYKIWMEDDLSVLPSTYSYDVRDILFDLDAAYEISDLEDIGAYQYDLDYAPNAWSVTITVNRVEPCGAVTCIFINGDCFDVDLREYNP